MAAKENKIFLNFTIHPLKKITMRRSEAKFSMCGLPDNLFLLRLVVRSHVNIVN